MTVLKGSCGVVLVYLFRNVLFPQRRFTDSLSDLGWEKDNRKCGETKTEALSRADNYCSAAARCCQKLLGVDELLIIQHLWRMHRSLVTWG